MKSTESGSFEITWKPPEYPNGLILGYTIYYSDEPQKSWERWQSTHSTKSPLKVSSLILKDHRYAVRISSFTGSGAGPLSEPFLVQTLQGGTFYLFSNGNTFSALLIQRSSFNVCLFEYD